MKKLIIATLLALALPVAAFAAGPVNGLSGWKSPADCQVPPDHGIWDETNTKLTGCITDAAWQAAQAEAASRSNLHLPVIAADATVVDEMGVVYEHACPALYFWGCVDLTHTDAYRTNMRSIARELIAAGYDEHSAPIFAGWIKSVR